MKSFLDLRNVTLDIPIFDGLRSFRASLMKRYVGGRINHSLSSKKSSVRALEDVSLHLNEGDHLGLIGHNGSGKTTLLRILAGIYKPSYGEFQKSGKVTGMFNTSPGIDPDDSGLANIAVVGMYFGMSRSEITKKTQDIIEFSDLGDFIHLPVRTYSAGMLARLAFGIATAIEPNILLLDEGIGAGDASFAKKAKKRLKDFYKNINILVMASHSNQLIKELCNKALLLEHGRIIAFGKVNEVIEVYENSIKAC